MPAYVIALRKKTTDEAALATYSQMAKPTIAGKAALRVYHGRHKALEGPEVEGVVVLEFPTYEEAEAWYDSPAYQEAKQQRLKGGDFQFILVEGM